MRRLSLFNVCVFHYTLHKQWSFTVSIILKIYGSPDPTARNKDKFGRLRSVCHWTMLPFEPRKANKNSTKWKTKRKTKPKAEEISSRKQQKRLCRLSVQWLWWAIRWLPTQLKKTLSQWGANMAVLAPVLVHVMEHVREHAEEHAEILAVTVVMVLVKRLVLVHVGTPVQAAKILALEVASIPRQIRLESNSFQFFALTLNSNFEVLNE